MEAVFRGIQSRLSSEVRCGAVVFVQRFTKTLSCFPHFHALVLDGGYVADAEVDDDETPPRFVTDRGPTAVDLRQLEARVLERFSRWLARRGYLEDDVPADEPSDTEAWWLSAVRAPSGLTPVPDGRRPEGFVVHAGVRMAAGDRRGREQLCRYAARPPLAEAQLEVQEDESVKLSFRSPTRSGQSSMVLHPVALVRRLAWLVPPPRRHQLRYAGVLAPASRLRRRVVSVGRVAVQVTWVGPRKCEPFEPVPYRAAWARLLARVYDVDGQACEACGGPLRPVGAGLPPDAATWLASHAYGTDHSAPTGTGPPPAQLRLPLAG